MNLTNLRVIKADIAKLVRWETSLPSYVFVPEGYGYAYFFESPVAGSWDLLSEIVEFLSSSYEEPGYISIGHDGGTGEFDPAAVEQTMLRADAEELHKNGHSGPFFQYLRCNPYTGITCGSHPTHSWILYDDPSDGAGVLVSKKQLRRTGGRFRYLLPAAELPLRSGPSGLDWSAHFVEKLMASYPRS